MKITLENMTSGLSIAAILLAIISVVGGLTIWQVRRDSKEIDDHEPLKVGSCYVFSDVEGGEVAVYKITNHDGGIAYTERTWEKKSGWSSQDSISERHSIFYSEVKCPKETP